MNKLLLFSPLIFSLCSLSAMSFRTSVNEDDYSISCINQHQKKIGHINFHTDNDSQSAVIRKIYVTPEQRNKGIGSRLLLLGLEQLRSQNIREVHLDAVDSKHFFSKHGAQELEPTDMHLLSDTIPMAFYLNRKEQQ